MLIDASRNKTFKEADTSVSFSVKTTGLETSRVPSIENDFVTKNSLNLGGEKGIQL